MERGELAPSFALSASEQGLVAESRPLRGKDTVRAILIMAALAFGLAGSLLVIRPTPGHEGRVYALQLFPILLWLVLVAWLTAGREQISVSGTEVRSRAVLLGLPIYTARYDLLRMRGLCVAGRRAPIQASLSFWYVSRPQSMGWFLGTEQAQVLAEALLEYEASVRDRLGLPAKSGLLDLSDWTEERAVLAAQGLEDTEADRRGRFLG